MSELMFSPRFVQEADYIEMCKLMVTSNTELEKRVTENKLSDAKEVVLFIGPSKAGKSTMLGRIKSKLPVEEFIKLINAKDENTDFIDIEDIKIGFSSRATTTVPNFHNSKLGIILDMPGFVEANPKREAVVGLINKSVFNKIKFCKLVVVIDMIFIESMNAILQLYVKELKSLLTDEYFSIGLLSCIFAITKADKHLDGILDRVDEDLQAKSKKITVRNVLNNYVADVRQDNDDTSRLASAIARNFIIIDYRETSQDSTVELISKCLINVKPIEGKSIHFNSSNVHDILSMSGQLAVESMKNNCSKHVATMNKLTRELKDNYTKAIKEISAKLTRNKEVSERLIMIKQTLSINAQTIQTNNVKVVDESNEIDQIKDDKKQLIEQMTHFRSKFHDMTMLDIIALKSVNSTSLIAPKQKVYADVVKPVAAKSSLHILILETQTYDSNKSDIDACKSIRDLESLKTPYLFYDGKEGADANDIKIIVKDTPNNSTLIMTESKVTLTHVVLCICELQLIELKQIDLLADVFSVRIINCDSLVTKKLALIESLKADTVNLTSATTNLTNESLALQSELEHNVVDIASLKSTFLSPIPDLTKQVELIDEEVKFIITAEKFYYTEQLAKVLLSHSINIDAFKDVQNIKDKFAKLTSDCHSYLIFLARCESTIEAMS